MWDEEKEYRRKNRNNKNHATNFSIKLSTWPPLQNLYFLNRSDHTSVHTYGGWFCENTTPDDYSEFDSSESCADVTCSSVPSSVAASWRTSLLSTRASISTQATMSPGTRLWFRCPQFKRSVVRTRHYVLIVRRNVDTHDLALVPGQCL